MKSKFRRTLRQGKCTSTPASLHLSNTTAKRKGIARSLLGEAREVAEMNCVDIIGGDFSMAAFRETRNLGRIEGSMWLGLCTCSQTEPRCGGGWRTLPIAAGSSERPKTRKTWKIHQRGNIQVAHLLVYTH